MTEIKNENIDGWKQALRSALILGMTGKTSEKIKAIIDVGRYYTCYAPTSLYKYYSDDSRNLEAVKNNQMWYSAPCNFNDVFDCTITIEETMTICGRSNIDSSIQGEFENPSGKFRLGFRFKMFRVESTHSKMMQHDKRCSFMSLDLLFWLIHLREW